MKRPAGSVPPGVFFCIGSGRNGGNQLGAGVTVCVCLFFRHKKRYQIGMQVLEIAKGIIGSGSAAFAYDYLSVTGSAARFTSFDYRYFPLSKLRVATIGLLAAALLFAFVDYRPDNPPIFPLILCGVALVVHCVVGQLDVFAQRKTGYRIPPNYGEWDR